MKKVNLVLVLLIFLFAVSCNETKESQNEGKNDTKTDVMPKATAEFNTVDDMIADAKTKISEITPDEFKAKVDGEETFVLIDLRAEKDFNKGHIKNALNIPRGVLEFRIQKDSFWEDAMIYTPKKDELIILNCKSGKRSALATLTLMTMGYTNVKSLVGGYNAIKKAYPDNIEIPVQAEGFEPEGAEEDDGGC